ncbi:MULTISPECIES: hypothetical protein [Asticcacaulis]|uniref:hypothetical protein n=1 Tax=Asticcacaulis TaxID=76890 RepID=UPI001AE45DB0|nr:MULTISPECIES: hypothetical protein [Asticcacaulis]MBP2157483.1 plasmid maintenance system antidote protein VapI [Asticcacaulis solisilvae]MDR6798528.1 plasmid maintenance system antidote protein VapI [Asticcacaulis sp. BE141]
MTDQSNVSKRDEVLFAFHRDCDTPTIDQIIEWTQRYPEFADDIRAHAAIMHDWAANDEAEEETVDELLMTRARSRALNAIYSAQAAEKTDGQSVGETTFDQLLSAVGLDTRQLARAIDIGRDVLSDLFRGRTRGPIGPRLVTALLDKLQATQDQFEKALAYALNHPSMGHASSSRQPTVIQSTFEESVRRSNMPPERKSYWLEED